MKVLPVFCDISGRNPIVWSTLSVGEKGMTPTYKCIHFMLFLHLRPRNVEQINSVTKGLFFCPFDFEMIKEMYGVRVGNSGIFFSLSFYW